MLVTSIVFFIVSRRMRVLIRPGVYGNPPLGIALVFAGFSLFGTSIVLLLRSPFRMPPGERIFRLLWLGPIGRGFVRLSMRGVKTRSGVVSARPRAVPVVIAPSAFTGPPIHAPADPLAALEGRVKELERWRLSRGE
jgi:hypothetical protein